MKFFFERQRELPAGAKILVCLPPALGDFVLCLPALAALRAAHPGAHVEALAMTEHCKVIDKFGLADGSTIAHPGINQPTRADTAAAIDSYFGGFDSVYSLLGHGFRPKDARMKRVFPVKPDRSYSEWVLRGVGLAKADATPRIVMPGPTAGGTPAVVLHTDVSPVQFPAWSPSKWLSLAAKLSETHKVIVVGGRHEAFSWAVAKVAGPNGEVAANLSLDALVEKLGTAGAFVCADSGIGHLCSALGLKGVTMHAKDAAHLAVWRPHGAVRVIRAEDGVEAVLTAVQGLAG
jgi:ADP-heptose:LPS heptosyltransferase